jgi:membrane glycosyltransferase
MEQNDQKQNQMPEALKPAEPYYVGTMPAETPPKNPGKTEGIIAIVCACVALLFVPPLFGIIGILLGVKSKQKGQKTLATVAIVLSSVFMVLGVVLGVLANIHKN